MIISDYLWNTHKWGYLSLPLIKPRQFSFRTASCFSQRRLCESWTSDPRMRPLPAVDPMGKSGSPKSHLHDTYYIKNDYHDFYYSFCYDIYIYVCYIYIYIHIYIYILVPPQDLQFNQILMVFTVFFLTFWPLQLRALSGDEKLHFFLQFCSHPTLP